MPKSLRLLAIAGLACLGAAAAVADGSHGLPGNQRPPSGMIHVSAGGERLTVWPYTTDDLRTPSDPINLVFPNADPRAIRQELMKPKGPREFPFNLPPFGDCQWTDGMGYEQAAYGLPERWVGGAIQLACVHEGAPLGDPFRLHVRLFRNGKHTLGAAHFEVLIDKTPEHEVLSWDYARAFVTHDMDRTGTLVAAPVTVDLIPGGYFREVRRAVYDGILNNGGGGLLALLGLVAPADVEAPVPIPLGGIPLGAPTTLADSAVLATAIDFEPARTHVVTTTEVTFDRLVPKPFCAGVPAGHVGAYLLGPLHFTMSVSTGPSGRYERTYAIGGTLDVTAVPAGDKAPASIFEIHQAAIDDRQAQVTEKVQQSLIGDPFQSLAWSFAAGDVDRFLEKVVCGVE
jgi:hypothetical protein